MHLQSVAFSIRISLCVVLLLSGCSGSNPTTRDAATKNDPAPATVNSVPSEQSTDKSESETLAGEATGNASAKPATDTLAASPPQTQTSTTEGVKSAAAPTSASASKSDPALMSRKDMLKFVGSGVVVVTALDAKGDITEFGSGCIVGKDLVLTNQHVVTNAVSAKIQLKGDGDERLGKELPVAGYRAMDDRNDLILLTVEGLPSELYVFAVPDSDTLEQHDQVFCMGHPDGLKFSTSSGFVSALLKTSDMPEQLQAVLQSPDTEWIQTDAVISGGSSGGPLVDDKGRLVGVSTLVIPDSRIAFAVTASHVRTLLSQATQPVKALPLPDADVITTKSLADVRAGFDREFQQLIVDVRRLQATNDAAGMRKLIRRNNPGPACLRQCVVLAEKHKGAAEAADALKISADVLRTSLSLPDPGRQFFDELLAKATSDPALIPLSPRVVNSLFGVPYSAELETYLRGVISSDQPAALRAAAGVVLVNAMASGRDESMKADMLDLASEIKERFGNERFRSTSIEDVLNPLLDAEKLSIGSLAPEIIGTDASGQKFRLTDYRGKVVMLDFWADWCPHCRNMYSDERELVEKLKDKPFALLGVNGDEPDRAKSVIEAGTVTWRSWLDGAGGPIADLYKIEVWPTVLVLDATGRIRFSGLRGADLEVAIESLLNDSPKIVPQDILPENAVWKYLPLAKTAASDGWNQSAFDDSKWQAGQGSFAFAERHQGGTDLTKQPSGERPVAMLFRTTFNADPATLPKTLLMNIQYRDGVTVFLNGKEIYRGNLHGDADSQSTAVCRATAREEKGIVVSISSEGMQAQGNCLAVSLHQFSTYSAAPLLSLSLGKMLNLSTAFEALPSGEKSQLCRVVSQAGMGIPEASSIVEKLQTDDSEMVKISAAIAAAMNGLPVTMSELTQPTSHQHLYETVVLLNRDAWKIVESQEYNAQQYAEALRMANAAFSLQSRVHPELQPGTGGIENTLGVALYRNQQYEKAIHMLESSLKSEGENPTDVAYLALAHFKLGKKDESQQHKAHFDELMKNDEWRNSSVAARAQKELNAVIQ